MTTQQQNNNSQELDRRIEQLLTPRFTPSAEGIRLSTPPHSKSPVWLNTLRIAGVAAAIIVGLFIFIEPSNEVIAKTNEVIAEALEQLQSADSFRAEFQARVVEDSNPYEPYTIAPDGEDMNGELTILKSEGKEYMRVEWGNKVVQLFDNREMRYRMWRNGQLICDEEHTTTVFKLLQLASLGGAKAIIKTADVSMNIEESGDNILVKAVNEDSSVELEGVFSRKNGELFECGTRVKTAGNEWVKVLSAKIEYNYPTSVEQITAAPTK